MKKLLHVFILTFCALAFASPPQTIDNLQQTPIVATTIPASKFGYWVSTANNRPRFRLASGADLLFTVIPTPGTTTTVLHGNAVGDPSYGVSTGADFGSQTQFQVFAAPSGGNGNPGFRLLTLADLPGSILTGTPTTTGDIMQSTAGGQAMSPLHDVAVHQVLHSGGVGALAAWGQSVGADFGSQTQFQVFAAPSGGNGNPGFRLLTLADLPSSGAVTVGTSAPLGGGGAVSLGGTLTLTCTSCLTGTPAAVGDLMYSTAGGQSMSRLADVALNQVLHSGGVGAAPAYSAVVGADFGSQTQFQVFAAPSGGNGNPGFRLLTLADLPGNLLNGTPTATGDLMQSTAGGQAMSPLHDVALNQVLHSGGVGALAAWGLSVGADFGSQTQFQVFAAPSGGNGNPGFRLLTLADLPGNILNGTPTTTGDIMQSTAGGQAMSPLHDVAVNQVLHSGGVGALAAWGQSVGADFGSQTQFQVFAAPSGGNGNPGFRLLVSGDIPSLLSLYASVSTTISAGTGLTGGGDLSANRTISLPNTGPGANSCTLCAITIDAQGRVTADSSGTPVTSGGTGSYGDGSDGTVTFDGATGVAGTSRSGNTYTLTRDVFYSTATVNSTIDVVTNGFRFFCFDTGDCQWHDPLGWQSGSRISCWR